MSMNIYVHEKGIILTGKAWEIRQKLKEYANHFHFVSDWVESLPENTSGNRLPHPGQFINLNIEKRAGEPSNGPLALFCLI